MNEILHYLTIHGECIDADIAGATGIPLSEVRKHLSELADRRAIMTCSSTRFEHGKETREIVCRLTGYVRRPAAAPARKSKVQLKLS